MNEGEIERKEEREQTPRKRERERGTHQYLTSPNCRFMRKRPWSLSFPLEQGKKKALLLTYRLFLSPNFSPHLSMQHFIQKRKTASLSFLQVRKKCFHIPKCTLLFF